ncbi:MAG: formylglycine-generating enzyme family protein [Bacteroidales bacterium]|nr:formylglycine-generating enzyme family protein [Bacteroidales bacterium]
MKILFMLCCVGSLFAETSQYELNGQSLDNRKTRNPKAVVSVEKSFLEHPQMQKKDLVGQDTLVVSLNKGEQWLELEKNRVYSVCIENGTYGKWKADDFEYSVVDSECVNLKSGNYVKNGKIQYVTQMGNVVTFNLLVGMKYIDLSTQEHLLGANSSGRLKKNYSFPATGDNVIFLDPERKERINKVLAVDEYKVTECEFIQTLWDSIPSNPRLGAEENHKFWINKKKQVVKDGFCDAHDSAAVRVFLYHALVYANARSVRDGLKPVYSFKQLDRYTILDSYEDYSFSIFKVSFFDDFDGSRHSPIMVNVDQNADGYRLPYYDEWMALARGGENIRNSYWEGNSQSASQYAWFGVIEPEDRFLKMSEDDPFERDWLAHSYGKRMQKSRPVGMLKPNKYGLYDMLGLVCENVTFSGKNLFRTVSACKGGFLADSLKALNFGAHYDNNGEGGLGTYQGLRLVRQIK